ncbi:hypothetical protein [Oleiphilus sp. HI0061]
MLLGSTFCASAPKYSTLDIYQLSREVSAQTGYTIIFSPRVRSQTKVSMLLSKKINPESLYSIFLSVLNVHGYAAIRDANLIKIVRERKARYMYSSD